MADVERAHRGAQHSKVFWKRLVCCAPGGCWPSKNARSGSSRDRQHAVPVRSIACAGPEAGQSLVLFPGQNSAHSTAIVVTGKSCNRGHARVTDAGKPNGSWYLRIPRWFAPLQNPLETVKHCSIFYRSRNTVAHPLANALEDVPTDEAEDVQAWTLEEQMLADSILDVGFLDCQLRSRHGWPKFEVYIHAWNTETSEDGIAELLRFMDSILNLDMVAEGFDLTYDIRKLWSPPADVIGAILRWSMEIRRRERWGQRCKGWKVIVPEGAIFELARYSLSLLFYFYPPTCCTELISESGQCVSFGTELSNGIGRSNTFDFSSAADKTSGMLSGVWSAFSTQFSSALYFDESPHQGERLPLYSPSLDGGCDLLWEQGLWEHTSLYVPQVPDEPLASASEFEHDSGDEPEGLISPEAEHIDVGFAVVDRGFDEIKNFGYLRITGLDEPFSERGLAEMMDFMDQFTNSADAAQGFSMTYDLRQLRIPSMNMVMRVAEWGKDPQRKLQWETLNTVCKVVLSPGMKFTLCKGILNSFFFVCPPVCRTYLLTDPDEPEDKAIVFEAPSKCR